MPGWSVGLTVALAVLAAATVFGVVWRRRDGVLRPVGSTGADEPVGTDSGRATDVRVRATDARPGYDGAGEAVDAAILAELGVSADASATLLQFSSAFCAPCRATRRVCAEVAAMLDGVRHVEVDAESHLDVVRALKVMRTPTLFVLDGTGRVVRRAGGVPTKPHLVAAVAPLLSAATHPRG